MTKNAKTTRKTHEIETATHTEETTMPKTHASHTPETPKPTKHASTTHHAPLSSEAAFVAASTGSLTTTDAPIAPVATSAQPVPAPTEASPPTSPAAAATATNDDPTAATTSATSVTRTARFVAPPPVPDPAFVPPPGFVSENTMDFRGVLPRSAELVALPSAVNDLEKFTDYTVVMGSKAPPLAHVLAAFDITNQWSSARTQADAWDQFARTQEGVCWVMLRALMAQMSPIYQVAVASDPTMASTLPGLTTLLGAKKAIAHKAVSTKKANAKAEADGKEPTHGEVGKKATRAAQKAALAAQKAAAANGAAGAQAPVAPVAPVVANGVTNGAAGGGH